MTNDELSLLTKKQLAAALRTAMSCRPFSKITVSELVNACGINRKTFYYHFEDIFDLLRWTLEVDETELIQEMYSTGNYQKCVEYLIDYIEKNRYLINCACDSVGQIGLRRFFENDFYKLTARIIESGEEKPGHKLNGEYKDFLIRSYAYGTATILLDWITQKKFSDRNTTTKYILRVLHTLEQNLDMF